MTDHRQAAGAPAARAAGPMNRSRRATGFAGLVRSLWDWFLSIPNQRPLIYALIVVNFLGSLYGFYWYRDQLITTAPWMWIFVADSPLSTFYLTTVLLLFLSKRNPAPLDGLAYLGLVKYGFWTMFVIGLFWVTGGAFSWVDLLLFLSHLAMLVQSFLFFRRHPATRASLGFAMAWYLVNDYLDYFKGYHPYYPEASPEFAFVRTVSLVSTWVVFAIFWLWRVRLDRRMRTLSPGR